MIYCVEFAEVEEYLTNLGFRQDGETGSHYLYAGQGMAIAIHKPNPDGDVTLISIKEAFDSIGIDPPNIAPHWCD